jgi:AraC family transcriptional regulator
MRVPACQRFQNPAPLPTFRPLFRGDAVGVFDWRCPGCDTPAHEAEYNDAYEVVVVREGAFVREVNEAPALITAGTLMFASAGEVHRISHPVPGGDACSVFRGSVETLREMLGVVNPAEQERPAPRFPLRQTPLGGREYLLHRLAMRAAGAGTEPVEQEESALWFLYAALAFASARRDGQVAPTPALRGAAWRKALEYTAAVEEIVRGGFPERLTLAAIGRAAGCSPFHLSRLVRAVTGLSIHRILVRQRLRHALELVLSAGTGLSAIAYAAGFGSHSHLTDAFRREYGCNPDQVRRRRPAELRRLLGRGSR